jgi:hypothetical protein
VQSVLPAPGSGSPLPGAVVASTSGGGAETYEADALVLAAGVRATQRLVSSSPALAAAEDLRRVEALRCGDVLAARVWLDRRAALPFRRAGCPGRALARPRGPTATGRVGEGGSRP